MDVLSVDYTYDQRGRLKVETATLTPSGAESQTAKNTHAYDVLGRPAATSSLMPNCPRLTALRSYTLQGWTDTLSVSLADSPLFLQDMGYDSPSDFSGHVPQYSGMVSMKSEIWTQPSAPHPHSSECYVYDNVGRLVKSGHQGNIREYAYDQRGNILSEMLPASAGAFNYEYDGDILKSLTSSTADAQDIVTFTHDALGRMTFDGTTGQSMTYNSLDLVGNISRDGTTLVNYSYLSDGTKLSALDGSGEGLVYRGPFVYRKSSGSNAGSSLTLESAAFGGGRMTPDGALLYVTDYLGSVRAVVDGKTGNLYKASEYSAFGDESQVMVSGQGSTPAHALATAALPTGLTLRDAYTGKEAQTPDFSTGYTDFGARQYSPTLRRWMTPDPLSEKYYGVSPYAFCNNNPVNFVDPDGEAIDLIVDVISIGCGIYNLTKNIIAGNASEAWSDAAGIGVDLVCAIVPGLTVGSGVGKTVAKATLNAIDAGADASKTTGTATSVTKSVEGIYSNVSNPRNAGPGKDFTKKQKQEILQANMDANGGVLKSDGDGRILNPPQKSLKGQKADMNQAEVDHIEAKSKGGTNHTYNAQVLSKEENLRKSNK